MTAHALVLLALTGEQLIAEHVTAGETRLTKGIVSLLAHNISA